MVVKVGGSGERLLDDEEAIVGGRYLYLYVSRKAAK